MTVIVPPPVVTRLNFAVELLNLVGIPYQIGGRYRHELNEWGADCWGVGSSALRAAGGPDLSAWWTQHAFDHLAPVYEADLKLGDAIFYGRGQGEIDHVVWWLPGGMVVSASNGSAGTTTPEIAAARHAKVMVKASARYGHGTPIQGFRSMAKFLVD